MSTVRDFQARPKLPPRRGPAAPGRAQERRPFRDNPRLILAGMILLLGLTIVPSLLVLVAGSELIRKTTDRWFSAPVSDVLTSANEIAGAFCREREDATANQAQRIAAALPAAAIVRSDLETLRAAVAADVNQGRVGMVEIYRLDRAAA